MKTCGKLRYARSSALSSHGIHRDEWLAIRCIKLKTCGELRYVWPIALPACEYLRHSAVCLDDSFAPIRKPAANCGMPGRLLTRSTRAHCCSVTPLSSWEWGWG